MQEGIHNYNNYYFLEKGPDLLNKTYHAGVIRAGDMGAALCFARDIFNFQDVLEIDEDDPRCSRPGFDFHDQVYGITEFSERTPKFVVSIGCGRGEMEAAFHLMNIPFVAVDPSPAIPEILHKTMTEWAGAETYNFIHKGCKESIRDLMAYPKPDTIIFCESFEHVPEADFEQFWVQYAHPALTETSGRLIISNYKHPIRKYTNEFYWDHVRDVNDSVFDNLESRAKTTIYRHNGHLVLDF